MSVKPHKTPADLEVLATLARLRRVADALKGLQAQVYSLEEEALIDLHGETPVNGPLIETELAGAEGQLHEALLALYVLRFPNPDVVLLAIYSEEPERLFELARAYERLVGTGSLKRPVEVWQFLPTQAGRDRDPAPERRLIVAPANYFEGETTIAVRDWDKRTKSLKREEHSAHARQGVIGVSLTLRGTNVFPLLAPETGLHTFVTPKEVQTCLVETSDRTALEYQPPDGIDRRGFIGSQSKRRTYNISQEKIEDALLDARFHWSGHLLDGVLAEVIDQHLRRRLEALTAS